MSNNLKIEYISVKNLNLGLLVSNHVVRQGFEPQLVGSEPTVLPLDDRTIPTIFYPIFKNFSTYALLAELVK